MISSTSILGPQGRIAARLPGYEHRPQQLAMADVVERAIVDGHHLVVEAGTGVGKSFAYLVPAISYVTAEPPPPPSEDEDEEQPFAGGIQKPRRRVIISTHTISLQE
ncbi:MAG: helicase, partial [Planctomycetia bacterium]|nr:helicase [Planctomycetia bacterium]